jgi:hypothetical protein
VRGYLGLVRSAFGDVKNNLLDDTGISAGTGMLRRLNSFAYGSQMQAERPLSI